MPIPLGILAVAGAGGGGGLATSYDLLETTVLGSSAASITFSNLNNYSDYKHLQLRMVVRSARIETSDDLLLRINGDSGSNYAQHILRNFSSSSAINETATSQSRIRIGTQNAIYAANANSNFFSPAIIDILDFASSAKSTTVRYLTGSADGSIINTSSIGSGLWNNTSSVTSLTILCANGNLATNSRVSLYGIK